MRITGCLLIVLSIPIFHDSLDIREMAAQKGRWFCLCHQAWLEGLQIFLVRQQRSSQEGPAGWSHRIGMNEKPSLKPKTGTPAEKHKFWSRWTNHVAPVKPYLRFLLWAASSQSLFSWPSGERPAPALQWPRWEDPLGWQPLQGWGQQRDNSFNTWVKLQGLTKMCQKDTSMGVFSCLYASTRVETQSFLLGLLAHHKYRSRIFIEPFNLFGGRLWWNNHFSFFSHC